MKKKKKYFKQDIGFYRKRQAQYKGNDWLQ